MAARKLKVLVNIGTDHQKQYGIPNGEDGKNPPQEGEVISVDDDKLADVLVHSLKCCKDYNAEEEKAHEEEVRAADAARMAVRIEQEKAEEQARKDAEKLAKGGK